jgi:uncharacterized iron-regulated membrane protein
MTSLPTPRRLIFNVHLSIALMAGAFILILGATGSVMAFEPELDRLLHPHLSYVNPGATVLTLQEIGNAVSQKFPNEPIVAFLPSVSPDLVSEVVLPRGIVSVNQYTGEVLGVRTRGQTFLGTARALHLRLATGDVGRDIMKWSGVAMLLSLASGVYLWWPVQRVRIRGNWRRRGFWFDLHNSLGILSFLPLLMLAVTGTAIGFEDQVVSLIGKLTGASAVRASEFATRREAAPGAAVITPDEAVAVAKAFMPGAIPNRVQMPAYGGVYRVNLLNPNERIAGGQNMIAIDPYSGSVVSSTRSADLLLGKRILATTEAIHTGEIFGMPSKIIMWLASLMLPVQVISGLLMWLRRNNVIPIANPLSQKGASGV